mmetsp:Transcript_19525/g.44880  ORF Transcript_19525/g.44880 Transcript_19525/m.44880 type:complete len:231 (-) Transcript_19525:51-743(-)
MCSALEPIYEWRVDANDRPAAFKELLNGLCSCLKSEVAHEDSPRSWSRRVNGSHVDLLLLELVVAQINVVVVVIVLELDVNSSLGCSRPLGGAGRLHLLTSAMPYHVLRSSRTAHTCIMRSLNHAGISFVSIKGCAPCCFRVLITIITRISDSLGAIGREGRHRGFVSQLGIEHLLLPLRNLLWLALSPAMARTEHFSRRLLRLQLADCGLAARLLSCGELFPHCQGARL